MLSLVKFCHNCKKESETCKRCTGCEKVWYCSKQCQADDWSNHKQACGKSENADSSSGSRCNFCSNSSSDLKRCKGCMSVSYCSKQCQRIDWPDHKKRCKHGDHRTKPVQTTGTRADKHENSKGSNCVYCGKCGCTLRCSRCKNVHYCSTDCQRGDWKTHKSTCKKQDDSDGQSEPRPQSMPEAPKDWDDIQYIPGIFRGMFLPPEMERIVATRPPGSLDKAKAIARRRFLFTPIIDDLDDVPEEHPFPFFREAQRFSNECVLVAFMFKYHPYARRHAIYIQDRKDEMTKVEFYLDFDNPFPFFSYSQLRPGNFLCLLNPLMHGFMDGSVGIRIDDPSEVTIIDGRSLT